MSKYQRWYDQLMERAKGRVLDCYFEIHHIQPRSLDGGDELENLVKLTYREHFLAHWLLTKMYTGKSRRSMLYALQCMGTMGIGDRIIYPWQYAVARKALSDYVLDKHKTLVLKKAKYTRERKFKDAADEFLFSIQKAGKKTVMRKGRRVQNPWLTASQRAEREALKLARLSNDELTAQQRAKIAKVSQKLQKLQ